MQALHDFHESLGTSFSMRLIDQPTDRSINGWIDRLERATDCSRKLTAIYNIIPDLDEPVGMLSYMSPVTSLGISTGIQ